jgi:hypothetical protein
MFTPSRRLAGKKIPAAGRSTSGMNGGLHICKSFHTNNSQAKQMGDVPVHPGIMMIL